MGGGVFVQQEILKNRLTVKVSLAISIFKRNKTFLLNWLLQHYLNLINSEQVCTTTGNNGRLQLELREGKIWGRVGGIGESILHYMKYKIVLHQAFGTNILTLNLGF